MEVAPRAAFVLGSAAAATAATFAAPLLARSKHARQFHNDVVGSTLDRALRVMWKGIGEETGGALVVDVHAENNRLRGGDTEAFQMLESGALQFFTLNGAIASNLVPLASFQTLPFAFRDHREVVRAIDGPPGVALVDAFRSTAVTAFLGGVFENGFRDITTTRKPLHTVADVAGLRWRVPQSELFRDFTRSLGATPVVVNLNQMPAALKDGTVTAQDNPLSFIANQQLDRLQHYVNMTAHMWAGFNFLANRHFFSALPARVRAIVEARLASAVTAQRAAQQRENSLLSVRLRAAGMQFIATDTSGFRSKLGSFYARWRRQYGDGFWRRLEDAVGHPIQA